MGTEVNANVNYNIMKGLDFGVYGAYAWLGDFFKSKPPGAQDPDDVYDVALPPELRVLRYRRNGSGTERAPGGNPGGFSFWCGREGARYY